MVSSMLHHSGCTSSGSDWSAVRFGMASHCKDGSWDAIAKPAGLCLSSGQVSLKEMDSTVGRIVSMHLDQCSILSLYHLTLTASPALYRDHEAS